MKYLIENMIINFSFIIDKSEENEIKVIVTIDDVRERIKMICDGIESLKIKYNTEKNDVNIEFLYIAKFIAQNIHILKHQLRRTYDRLPWKEMEFCLVSFISCHNEYKDFIFVCKIILHPKKIINYLEKFQMELNKLKDEIKEKDVNGKLSNQINKSLLTSTFELYSDYYLIKNIYSLKRIDHYVTLALEVDFDKEVELGKLVIERALQVLGEHIKNTAESPNLSDDVHDIILYSAPKKIKDIVTSLRNSLSHFHSLEKKIEFEGFKNNDLFKNDLQNDLLKIKKKINDVFYEMNLEVIESFISKIIESKDLLEVKELLNVFNRAEFSKIEISDGVIKEVTEIKELVEKLRKVIKNQSEKEKSFFDQIDDIIVSQQNKFKNSRSNYLHRLSILSNMVHFNNLIFIQNYFQLYLNGIKEFVPINTLGRISELVNDIYYIVKLREPFSYEVMMLIEKIHRTVVYNAGRFNGLNEFQKMLLKKDDDTEIIVKKTINYFFDKIIKKLKETSSQDCVSFTKAYIEKQKSYEDYRVKKEKLLKLKRSMTVFFEKLEKQQISKNHSLVQSTFTELDKLLKNKQLHKMFTNERWMDCKKKIETLEISRDSYETLFNSIKNYVKHEKYDISLFFRDFVSSFKDLKVKDDLIKYVHNIIDSIFKEQIQVFYDKRLKILKQLLTPFNNHEVSLQKYMEDKRLQAAVEIIVLDLTEVLASFGCLKFNQYSVDILFPILIGKSLRNYLAHGDTFIDILSFDPSISIFYNALRFIKEGQELFLNAKRQNCQNKVVNIIDLDNHYKSSLYFVTNQNDMFTAAKEGNLEKMKHHINKGADIKGRDYRGWSGLHFAAQGNNVEVLKFFLDKNISPNIQDIDGQNVFHIAATFRSNNVIKYLLEKGVDVNSVSKNNWTPLHLAAKNGHIEVVRTLLENKANINDITKDNWTALKLASFNYDLNMSDYLLENGAIIDWKLKGGFTQLHVLVYEDNIDEIEDLLINVNDEEKYEILEAKDDRGRTPLLLSVFSGHLDVVNILLKEGADVDASDKQGFTSLQLASKFNYIEIVKTLLKYEANINLENIFRYTALDLAVYYGYEVVVNILLQNKAYFVDKYGETLLHLAARKGHDKVIESLLNGKINIDATNKNGETALHVAVTFGHKNVIERLLNKNADINALNKMGRVPLHIAIESGKKEVVDLLLMKRAVFDIKNENSILSISIAKLYGYKDIVKLVMEEKSKVYDLRTESGTSSKSITEVLNLHFIFAIQLGDEEEVQSFLDGGAKNDILNKHGWRPLHFATQSGHKNIVKLLLERGPECNAKDNNLMTPLHFASRYGYTDIIEMLLMKVTEVDNIDIFKRTPLIEAVFYGYKKAVELLLYEGADINIQDEYGRTSLHYASGKCDKYMVELLLENGADFEIKDKYGRTPFNYKPSNDFESLIERLIKKVTDINTRDNDESDFEIEDEYGLIPLNLNQLHDYVSVIERLIKKGADINTRDNDGFSHLDFAKVCVRILDNVNVFERFVKKDSL